MHARLILKSNLVLQVTKLAAENEHLKQTYKQLFDSIKSSRVQSKEHCNDLINKVNLKSVEVSDLNASLQEKVLVITALKEQLSKLKGKAVLTKAVSLNPIDHALLQVDVAPLVPKLPLKEQLNKLKGKATLTEAVSLNPIDPELLKVDVAPLVTKLRKNRTAHTDYIRHTQEEAATLREILERTKLMAVTPKNKTKQIRPTEQITKSGKTTVTTPPSANLDSNTPVLSSTGVILVSSASGSMSQDNTKKNRIQRTQRKSKKNKIEDHLRTVKLVVQIVLWYLDSGCSKHMIGDRSQLVNFVQNYLGTVKFGNDHVAKIMGYGDYQIGNVTVSRFYYVEGLGHNLFSIGRFCDSDLEVAFRQHTCFIRNIDGVDLLTGSRGNNLYTLSLQDMMASS
nr:integrase, catalytic region, zinc finger, CCHC-type, peptidase aspartic, catalytic [Tanacetum cinerariifolium]